MTGTQDNSPMTQPQQPQSYALEPRVAKLEVGLDRLTEDVRDLAGVVRTQGQQVEQEIQKLVVAVTQAQGPRKTDWGVIIAACGLMMAIGSAAFWPLNQQVQENKLSLSAHHESMVEHQKLDNHPVGAALVKRLEEQIASHAALNERMFKDHQAADDKEVEQMRVHFHEELELIQKSAAQQIAALEAKVDLHNDRLYARVVRVEEMIQHQRDSDLNELRLWRLRAMNGDIQSKQPIGNDIIFDPHVPAISEPKTTQTPTTPHK